MTKLYKVTDRHGNTTGGYFENATTLHWYEGVSHVATGTGNMLCSRGVIHAYVDPLLAVLLDPIHGNYGSGMMLWEADGDVVVEGAGQLKVGCKTLKTIRKIVVPAVTAEQRTRFAILCAKEVYANHFWVAWADRWLSGEDRSEVAAAKEFVGLDNRGVEGWLERSAALAAVWAAVDTMNAMWAGSAAKWSAKAVGAQKPLDFAETAKRAIAL